MNILEAYIKKYNQFIVLILGLPCSNKSMIAKELVIDLNLPIININNYLKQDSIIEETIQGITFKLYEHPDNYDWEKLNNDVNEKKTQGLILYGNYIDPSKINFDWDFSFFLSMNTNLCKTLLIEKQILPYKDEEEKVKIYFDEIFNPIYEKLKKDIKINKFLNIKETTKFDETYDKLFDLLMSYINAKL